MRALHTAATGMAAQELNVQVISNNIANLRTTGFKKQRAAFQDLIYDHVRRVGAQASHVMAFARFAAGRYGDSVASAGETIERYPEYLPAHYVLIAAAASVPW